MPVAAPAAGPRPAPGVTDLLQVTDISGLAASPDGRSVAFRTERASLDRNSYWLAWHVADLGSGAVRDVAGGGDPVYADPGLVQAEHPWWSPDSSGFVHRALIDGAIGLWRTSARGLGSRPVVLGGANVESVEAALGGSALLYALGPARDEIERAERREYDQGILVDAHVDLAQNLFRGGAIDGRMASQRLTGRWFSRGGLLWREPRRWRRLDLVTFTDTPADDPAPASDADPPPPPGLAARSSRGDEALASIDGSRSSLAVRRPGGGTLACTAGICRTGHIVSLAWRPGRDELVITTGGPGFSQSLHLWQVGTDRVRFLAGGEGLLGSGERYSDRPCAITADRAICVAASAVSPPRLEAIDLASGARSVLFDPNSALRGLATPRVEQLAWQLADGRSVTAILLRPDDRGGRLPLFISYYRCDGFLRGGEGDEWPFAALVGAGIAVACVNAPAVEGEQDALASYQAALASIRALIDRLDARGLVDRSKIGMGGFSFGSEVTMWAAMRSGLLAAASIASTQIEPAYYWFNAVEGRDQPDMLRKVWGLGPPGETRARWRRVSPALNAHRIEAPLLLQLPEQEARLVVELYARLTRGPTPAELYAFPDEAHLKVQPRHRLAVYQRNLDWFRYWLKGAVDPDPAKAGQYLRWRTLAERRTQRSSSR